MHRLSKLLVSSIFPFVGRGSRWALQFHKLRQNNTFLFPFRFYTNSTTSTSDTELQPNLPLSPPPIRVGFTESAGRGVFATRRIEAGELIHTAKPIVAYPSLSSLDKVCYFCLRKLEKRTPSPLNRDFSFCSEQCFMQSEGIHVVEMKANWSNFDEYCRVKGVKYPLLVKRLACLVLSGDASANHLDILQPAVLSSEMISLMEKEFSQLRSALQVADFTAEHLELIGVHGQCALTFLVLTKQWYVSMLSRIRINAFRVELVGGGSYEDLRSLASASVNAEAAVGNAVYILPSFYNHDCEPNAHILWIENVDARVKALRDIEEGEELRICYIDASMEYEARQHILVEGFGFKCNCVRCSSRD